MILKDDSKMPFGKYINEKMANVPAEYLLWLLKENKCSGDVKVYILDNKEVLEEEVKRNKK